MKLSLSKVIDRPPPVVWQFLVINHIRNHPRWDPPLHVQCAEATGLESLAGCLATAIAGCG